MELTFLGAAQEVTGSSYLLESDNAKLLIDFGMFQGKEEDWNYQPLDIKAKEVNALLLTHAHLDHSGRIPVLVKNGFRGPIFATPPTIELTKLLWEDTVKLMKEEKERLDRKRRRQDKPPVELLFDEDDIDEASKLFVPLPWNQTERFKEFQFTFRPSGHILGASSIEVNAENIKLVFSGDLGPQDTVLEPPPYIFEDADYVVIESTYGDRQHKDIRETRAEFKNALSAAIRDRSKVLIPTFVVDRAQRIIYELYLLLTQEMPELASTPMFFDSPLGNKITAVYSSYPEYLLPHLAEFFQGMDQEKLGIQYIDTPEQSKKLNNLDHALIMAGSGMCTGGRILHHLKHGLWNPKNHLIFVGYQAAGTLGRSIVDGARNVKIMGEDIAVRAQIHTINGFSSHADAKDLLSWASNFPPNTTFLVTHGEPKPAKSLAVSLGNMGYHSVIPARRQSVTLRPRKERIAIPPPEAYTIGQKIDNFVAKYPHKRKLVERVLTALLESLEDSEA